MYRPNHESEKAFVRAFPQTFLCGSPRTNDTRNIVKLDSGFSLEAFNRPEKVWSNPNPTPTMV